MYIVEKNSDNKTCIVFASSGKEDLLIAEFSNLSNVDKKAELIASVLNQTQKLISTDFFTIIKNTIQAIHDQKQEDQTTGFEEGVYDEPTTDEIATLKSILFVLNTNENIHSKIFNI